VISKYRNFGFVLYYIWQRNHLTNINNTVLRYKPQLSEYGNVSSYPVFLGPREMWVESLLLAFASIVILSVVAAKISTTKRMKKDEDE
jgi:hypothetical protein